MPQMKLNGKRMILMKLKQDDAINETEVITNSKLR